MGQSVITSYSIHYTKLYELSQVRKAIRTFGEPSVVIEGHTDSTGSAAINAQLSKDRAEAVRQYFIAGGSLAEAQVTAIGYGSERPLVPNDTPEHSRITSYNVCYTKLLRSFRHRPVLPSG